MTGSEVALLVVTIGFAGLVLWVYWPSNRSRLESYGAIPLDEPPSARIDKPTDEAGHAAPGEDRT
jgi:cbb3-type cytochrome oxidase subunit 3